MQTGRKLRKSWDVTNKILSVIVIAIVAAVYLYFSFWLN